MGDGTRPTTEHATQILGTFWEDSIAPADLMSRSLAAGRASADAFRAASEGSAAAIRLGLSGTGLFVERASGTWFQAFLPFVEVGETFSQIALTFANMSRALAETNVAQAEVVYQAEAEIQAVRTQATALGQDPTPAINAIIADAQARVSALSANCVATVIGTGGAGGYGFTGSTGASPAGIPPSPITNSVGESGRGPEFTTSSGNASTKPDAPISNSAGGDAKPPGERIVDSAGQTALIGGGGSGGGGGGAPSGLGSTAGGSGPSSISTQGVSSPSSPLSQSGLGGAPSQSAPGAGQMSPASNVSGPSASPTDGAANAPSGAPSSPSSAASSSQGLAGSPTAQSADAPTAATSTGTSQSATGIGATPLLAAGTAGGVGSGVVAPASSVAPAAASVGASAPAVPANAMSSAASAAQAAGSASAGAVPTVSAPASAMPTPAATSTPPVTPGHQIAGTIGPQPTPQASSPTVSVPTSPPAPPSGQGSSNPETPDPILQLVPLGIVPVIAWQDLADTPRQLSPEGKLVYNVLASILGSLRDGPHGPDSGLDWAVALLTSDEGDTQLAITTRDAGWLPPGVLIPRGARVTWNVPTGVPWATVDDPVRQLLEHSTAAGYKVLAIATTHPSRAYADHAGADGLIEVTKPGPVLPDGVSRLEAIASPGRFARIAGMTPEDAARQTRALLRDLERITDTSLPSNREKTRTDIRRFLEARKAVPTELTDQLQRDLDAVTDALAARRIDPREMQIGDPAPPSDRLRRLLIDRTVLHAVAAAVEHDVESAVYSWTVARFLASRLERPSGIRAAERDTGSPSVQ